MTHSSLGNVGKDLLETVLDTMLDGLIVIDSKGVIQSVNRAGIALFGYQPEDVIGKNVKMLMPEPYHANHDDYLKNYLTTGERKVIGIGREVSARRKDGSVFPMELGINEMRVGDARMFVGTIRDITQRKETESLMQKYIHALADSEERYKLCADGLSVGVWDWDVLTNGLYWSPHYKKIIRTEGLLKDNYEDWEQRLHPEDKQHTVDMLQGHLIHHTPYNVEYRLRCDDGNYIWIHAKGQAVWDDKGRARRMVGSIEDISWRKIAEGQLKDEAERLSAVMNTVLDGLITITDQGMIRSFNMSASRIFGYTPEEVIGQNVKMLMPDPYHSNHDTYLKNYLTTGDKKVIGIGREVSAKRKDGSVFPMELGINEMRINNERMFVGTIRDITERKAAETLMQDYLKKLTQSNTELERFAYVASHDLQEPIRMINNFGKILLTEHENKLDAEGQEYLHMVTESGERIRDVVNDLLDYSRLGSETIDFHVFDGNIAFASAIENLRALIEEQKAIITHDPLPELYGSPIQIMRLLQNLIANAIKYQPKGNIPRIHVGVTDNDATWDIYVRDNGLGISKQFLSQIFEPFRRLHTWDQIKGSGLGLSICKKIAETNGGALTVTSHPGAGSTFTISLPKAENVKEAA